MDIKEAIRERHSVRQYSADHRGSVRYNFEIASGHKCRTV